MKEGYMKNSSLTALAVAAGMLLGAGSAFAADLGGNCCADLEERVAELEATSAKKGTRKTSLEIYGIVNQAITGWDDGSRSNATLGYGNHNLQTRFGFRGNAKISPEYSAGYSLLIDWADKARTSTFSQTQDIGSSRGNPAVSTRTDDPLIRLRDANWWLESSRLGRVTVGRITAEGATGSPDIAGIAHAVGDDVSCNGGGLSFRKNDGTLTGSLGSYGSGGCAGPWANRVQGIKYTSPTFAGFQFVGSVAGNIDEQRNNLDTTAKNRAEAGRELDATLRYAGEHQGFRIAANLGYQFDGFNRDLASGGAGYSNGDVFFPTGSADNAQGSNSSGRTRTWNLGLGLLHVATGLFAQGEYSAVNYNFENPETGILEGGRDARRWHIAAGVVRNWFGLGNTALYGEYMRESNFAFAQAPFTIGGCTGNPVTYGVGCSFGPTSLTNIHATATRSGITSGDSVRTWGLGVNQAIDAAAMDLYLNYRNHELTDPNLSVGTKSLSIVTTGARIRF